MARAKLIGGGQQRAMLLLAAKKAWQDTFYTPESAVGIVSRQLARRNGICARKRPAMSPAEEARRLKVSSRLLAGARL